YAFVMNSSNSKTTVGTIEEETFGLKVSSIVFVIYYQFLHLISTTEFSMEDIHLRMKICGKKLWKKLRSMMFHHKHRNSRAMGLHREFSLRCSPVNPCFNFSSRETHSSPPYIFERHQPEIIEECERQHECTEKENNVDREAEKFIVKFHEQLKLQRQDSLLRYQEMLARGV
ncbi:hypothetical protein KI387_039025, partial [Taxus chinensis]